MIGGVTLWGVELMQSWAEGVGALGTAAAFGVAAFVYVHAERDRHDDEAAQARLVYAEREERGFIRTGGGTGLLRSFYVVNASDEPIYRPRVTGLVHGDATVHEAEPRHLAFPRLVPPQGRELVYSRQQSQEEVETSPAVVDVKLWFQDSHGRQWTRRDTDQPIRATEAGRLRRLVQRQRRLSDAPGDGDRLRIESAGPTTDRVEVDGQ